MKPNARFCAIAAASMLISIPAHAQFKGGPWEMPATDGVSVLLDCIEANERTLISAHRGGPSPGLPENSIEAMDALLAAIPAAMEIDVAQSPDGVLYLMHDHTLDRTTTGTGEVSEMPWEEIEALYLVDSAGWVTPYHVPTLRAALEWAKGRTVLQIDFKPSADREAVIDTIREAGMAEQVVLIAYSQSAALELHHYAPEMMISLSIGNAEDLDEAIEAGIPADRIFAFGGIRNPKPDLYSTLDDRDVEVIFGTLGRAPYSIDQQIARFGAWHRYVELGSGGVDMIATDRPREAAMALREGGRMVEAGQCGTARASD